MFVFTREKFYIWLEKAMELFRPENSAYYAVFYEEHEPEFEMPEFVEAPSHLPNSLQALQDFSRETFHAFFHTNTDLVRPEYEEEAPLIPQMTFEDAARFVMYANRENFKDGQQIFYQLWQDGTIMTALQRLSQTAPDHIFTKEEWLARQENEE